MNTEILIESKAARDGQLTKVTHESAIDTLSKAKALVFALWQGTGAATTEQMAEYYEVPAETVRTVFKRHRDELDSDGVKVLRGKALSEARFIMSDTNLVQKIVTIPWNRLVLRVNIQKSWQPFDRPNKTLFINRPSFADSFVLHLESIN